MRTIAIVLFTAISATLLGQSMAGRLEISHLAGDFYVFTTYRFLGGKPFPSNGMYLITDAGAVMIDTPWDTTQFQPLLDSIRTRHNKEVVLCIATHSHDDRIGGLEFYRRKGIKTYTTRKTDSLSRIKQEKRAEFMIENDTLFTVGQYSFETFFAGAGHTVDNIVMWFPKDRILYGGCLVKSTEATGLGNVADADLQAWPKTIMNIQRKFGKPAWVIPGHQGWADNRALEHTLELLLKKPR